MRRPLHKGEDRDEQAETVPDMLQPSLREQADVEAADDDTIVVYMGQSKIQTGWQLTCCNTTHP